MQAVRLMILFLLCAVLLAACDKSQYNYAVFSGRVTASDTSVYLADVKVFEESHNRLSTTTDSLGYFRLDGVSCEEHNIHFEKEGFEPYVFNFEYTGALKKPLISGHIILYRPGEEKVPASGVVSDSLAGDSAK